MATMKGSSYRHYIRSCLILFPIHYSVLAPFLMVLPGSDVLDLSFTKRA
jgi:hypothetical protein